MSIDGIGRVTTWKIVGATTPGYAKAVEQKLKKALRFEDVAAGTYSWSFGFCGSSLPPEPPEQPGRVWIIADSFGPR